MLETNLPTHTREMEPSHLHIVTQHIFGTHQPAVCVFAAQ
jgi:hypothetical protein